MQVTHTSIWPSADGSVRQTNTTTKKTQVKVGSAPCIHNQIFCVGTQPRAEAYIPGMRAL